MDSKNTKQLSRAQEKAKSFMEEHQVERIISEMLNSLVHSRDEKPVIFMIKYLATLVTESELYEHGITCKGPVPQRIPIITYPKFTPESDSLLKKYLTRDIWSNMKKKNTALGGNIQLCLKSGVQNMQSKIGVMASDEEAFKQFGDLFGPIIKDLHPKFDHRTSYKFEDLNIGLIDEMEISNKLEKAVNYQFTARRNFKQTPFSPLMTKEARLQVERKVVEVLGDLYGKYNQVNKLDEKDSEWLNSIGIDPLNKNEDLEAGGVNDDWPVGRGIFIQDNREFVVQINYEDHLNFVILKGPDQDSGNDKSFSQGIDRLVKTLQTFEKLGYATDSYLGNLTVSPQNLGTAMQLQCTLRGEAGKKIPGDIIQKMYLSQNMKYEQPNDTDHVMKTNVTLSQGINELRQIREFRRLMGEAHEHI